jgi:multidrug transporter EmrE-like cation transporter
MATPVLGLILLSVTISAVAQVLFKLGMSSQAVVRALASKSAVDVAVAVGLNPGVLGGLSLYGIGTVLWLGVLSHTQISQAYPFVGLGFVLTTLTGYFLFGDTLGASRVCGIALVVGGIFLVARS